MPAATRRRPATRLSRAAARALRAVAAPALRVLAALALATAGVAARADGPPPGPPLPSLPPLQPATDVYHGTAVEDPFRSLENTRDPAVRAWMQAQGEHTARLLARIPGRARLLEQLGQLDEDVPVRIGAFAPSLNDRWFYMRRARGDNQFKLVVRDGLGPDGQDRIVLNPRPDKAGVPAAINWFEPSPGGKLLAFGLSRGGSEAAVMHFVDVRNGRFISPPIDRADFGGLDWTRDGRYVVFNRLQAMEPGMPATAKYQDSQALLLRLGSPVEQARVVLARGMPGIEMTSTEVPFVRLTVDRRWAFGHVYEGTDRDVRLYVASQSRLIAGRPDWRERVTRADGVTSMAYHDDTLYLVSHRDAPRGQLLAMPLTGPDAGRTRVLLPPSERVLVSVAAANDALYLEQREGNVKKLQAIPWGSDEAKEVPLPVQGSFELMAAESFRTATHPLLDGVVIKLQSWNRAPQVWQVSLADGAVNTGLQPAGPNDAPPDVVATEVTVRAKDGALVPMSIVHRRDVVLDGRNPTILYGYASYGSTEEPWFSTGRLAWIQAGGVFAVANPRGSGVYGEEWYRAGLLQNKANSWNDFIACAEYLVRQRWTQPARLGILGGSAGGILVGRAMTERPDLFAAVVPAVGVLDMLRAETTPNGIPNIAEFGSVKTEAGFRALLAMSTYANVRPGVPYPAVLLTHGVNDPRVEVWMSSKTAARLQASSTSGRPVLLRLDWSAGHGIGNTRQQRLEESADVYSFFLWQFGMPGFQPRP